MFVNDMDGDGDLDIFLHLKNDDAIAWYENNGAANPSFTAVDIATNALGTYELLLEIWMVMAI